MSLYEKLGLALTKGDIGFEIEVESNERLPTVEGWNQVGDASLKSAYGREYVLSTPSKLSRFKRLFKNLSEDLEGKVYEDVKAGIHVHVNCQELTDTELVNFICLYLLHEDLLIAYCGEEREGNLFCLSSNDTSSFLPITLHNIFKDGRPMRQLNSNSIRYSSLNLVSLFRHGSLEFRSMRSTLDTKVVFNWTEALLNLREYAKKFEHPSQIFEKDLTKELLPSSMLCTGWKRLVKGCETNAKLVAHSFKGELSWS